MDEPVIRGVDVQYPVDQAVAKFSSPLAATQHEVENLSGTGEKAAISSNTSRRDTHILIQRAGPERKDEL